MLYSNEIKKLTIEDGVKNIGKYAFEENQIKSLVIPDSVLTIGADASGKPNYEPGHRRWR